MIFVRLSSSFYTLSSLEPVEINDYKEPDIIIYKFTNLRPTFRTLFDKNTHAPEAR